METNLAYAGGGDNQFGDVSPAMTLGNSHTGSTQPCYGDTTTMAANPTARCYWNPTGSNPTTYPDEPSTSTTGTGQFGFRYNWCTAMNSQPPACQITAATPADPSINICPLGWRLPTGEPTTGEFTLLNNTVNGGLTTSPSGLLTSSLFMFGGWFGSGSFSDVGVGGTYWSSTVNTATNARSIYFSAIAGDPTSSAGKGTGLAVRCVAP